LSETTASVVAEGRRSHGAGFGFRQVASWIFIEISHSSSFGSMKLNDSGFGPGQRVASAICPS
jgi:hypothetical protein